MGRKRAIQMVLCVLLTIKLDAPKNLRVRAETFSHCSSRARGPDFLLLRPFTTFPKYLGNAHSVQTNVQNRSLSSNIRKI